MANPQAANGFFTPPKLRFWFKDPPIFCGLRESEIKSKSWLMYLQQQHESVIVSRDFLRFLISASRAKPNYFFLPIFFKKEDGWDLYKKTEKGRKVCCITFICPFWRPFDIALKEWDLRRLLFPEETHLHANSRRSFQFFKVQKWGDFWNRGAFLWPSVGHKDWARDYKYFMR